MSCIIPVTLVRLLTGDAFWTERFVVESDPIPCVMMKAPAVSVTLFRVKSRRPVMLFLSSK